MADSGYFSAANVTACQRDRPASRERVDCARSAGPSSTGLTFGKVAEYGLPTSAERVYP